MKTQTNDILKLISDGEEIKLKAVDGTQNIYNNQYQLFSRKDEYAFSAIRLDQKSGATEETLLEVYETTQYNATFRRLYASLSTNLDDLCLTQHQILEFVASHPQWLKSKYGTYLLFKPDWQVRIAHIYGGYDGKPLGITHEEFKEPHKEKCLGGGYYERFVVPKRNKV
jgi:hypothetical protein